MSIGKVLSVSLVASVTAYVLMFVWGLDMGLNSYKAWVLLALTSVSLVGLVYGVIGIIKEGRW